MKEGYSATAPDLSSLVTKLKRAGPDVRVPRCRCNPDITLFLRQARGGGCSSREMLVGDGASYGRTRQAGDLCGGR